ncbi:MAG: helix-turn-helix transcriptional regulator [Alphaproteobacteria bacterium]|nr:helix-turn-helix transcriptional regulator [Alphaproteobacteria bacterium]
MNKKNHILAFFCEPLKTYLDIDWFCRGVVPLNSQGQAIGYYPLALDIEFLNAYMHGFDDGVTGKPFLNAIKETSLNSYSYFLWPNGSDCLLVQNCLQKIGLVRGLTIYKRYKDRIETWWFASKNELSIPNSITKSSVAPFQEFIRYFDQKQESNNLLCLSPFVKYSVSVDMSHNRSNFEKAEDFIAYINSNRFIMNIEGKSVLLSKREWECLSEMAQGKTYKGVANSLSLSPRTVEHYLNQIRAKTGVSYKSKLIDHFLANNQTHF